MNRKKSYPLFFIVFALFILSNTELFCRSNYIFKHYNINNGLSQNTVSDIFQDKLGFMWFATKDGLNRFDGTSFKIYKLSSGDDLRDNMFHCIVQDKDDNLWIGTDDGIYIYDLRKEVFNRFELTSTNNISMEGVVNDLLVDEDGDIWISLEEKGIFHYNINTATLTNYKMPQESEEMKMVSLCLGKEGHIWAFPYNLPFVKINKKTGEVSDFKLADNSDLFYNTGEIWDAVADEYNQLLITSSTKGLISVNTVNKTHRILLEEDAEGQSIFARCLAKIDSKTIWVGSESGLYIYNTETGTVENLRHNSFAPYSLSDNAIYAIYKDRDGGIWVGSYFGGVDYYSNQYNQFELFYPMQGVNRMRGNRVREFCEAPDGKIWIGTEDDGLNLFDPIKKEFLPLPTPLQSLYTNIHALYADGDYLWIATFSKGLNRFNLKTNELLTFTHSESSNSISHNSTFSICKDRQNTLWIGNLSGLNIYDYENNEFKQVEEFRGIAIQDIFEDTCGKIWVATLNKGLYRYDPVTSSWKNFSEYSNDNKNIVYNKTRSLFEDSQKRLWVTTQGAGFYLFDRKNEDFIPINSSKGLPNDVVYQLLEDAHGNLWLSTNLGLVKYNPQTESFTNYTVENGLRTNQFNYQSSFKASDGTLYFGSIDGFVRFNPSTFREPKITVPIVFTELFINNILVSPKDEKSLLKQSILFTDNLTLPYAKNSFRLSYAVLDFSNRNDSRIIYKLDGFDKEWIQSKSNNDIIYSNLKPGKYLLSLKLHNELKDSDEEILKTLTILIRPPFWFSGWAYLIYVMLFVIVTIVLIRFLNYRNQKLQAEKMNAFQQQKERELYQSKIDFFTNVAHEIRTPLSLIKAPLDQILEQQNNLPQETKENLLVMDKNTDRLLNLTNQLLDFRKTESDAYTLNLKVYNINEIVKETFTRFIPFANQNNIKMTLNLPADDLLAQVDKEAFIKIISNLINNAIKYGETFVNTYVKVLPNNDSVSFYEFSTENDGAIIPNEFKDDIYKSFVHIERSKKRIVDGTGIGLALAKSLTELLKGSINYNNESGYNVFRLRLPIGTVDLEEEATNKIETSEKLQNKLTILIVEDDVEMNDFLTKCLGGEYAVLNAFNGKEALSILKNEAVHVIVSDVMMPEMDGFEFTRIVKSDIETSHIPVILLTAKIGNQSKVEGYEIGADAYIEKPFSVNVLQARIVGLLQNRRKLQESYMRNPLVGATTMAVSKSDEEFIVKLHETIHDNLANPDFNVDDIAEKFNMSRAGFYRKIKGILDLTPSEYIRVERLKEAARLLKEKEYRVNEICYMVGFNSPSYFSKCFRQQFGVLPKDFV